MEKEAQISISIRDGKIEVSGSETFVREQIEAFKEIILKTLSTVPPEPVLPQPPIVGGPTPVAPIGGPTSEYQNVLAFDGDQVKILKAIPGKNKAEKTVNAALIYLHGKSLKGEESATFKEIRKVCEEHACLDPGNFSGTMKEHKELFLVTGSGKSQVVKLTHPGKTQAVALVKELNVL